MPLRPNMRSPKTLRLGVVLSAATLLFVLFQNFQPIPLKNLQPQFAAAYAHSMSATDGTADITRFAPTRIASQNDQVIAQPMNGSDLNSISQDWLARQSHLITGGADERFIADVNRRLDRLFRYEDLDEAFPGDEEDEATDGAATGHPNEGTRKPATTSEDSKNDAYFGLQPTSLQMIAVNHAELRLRNRTRVSCAIDGGSVKWNISRPISSDFDMNLQHEPAKAKSLIQLNYRW